MKSIIIPAAGKATRMQPLSSAMSKTMLPVNGKPIISYILDILSKESLIDEVIIIDGANIDIRSFVSNNYLNKVNYNIKFIQQEKQLGPLHAINLGVKETIKKNEILIWLGDTICLLDNIPMYDALITSKVIDPHRWCMVDKDNNFYDKPDKEVPTDQALIGIYNFVDRKHFDKCIDEAMNEPKIKGEHQISSLLNLYKRKRPFNIIETDEWYDCGELHTYYESKARLIKRSSRSFNQLHVDLFTNTITKSSELNTKKRKIELEKKWFTEIKDDLKPFIPKIFNSKYGHLKMSWEPGSPLCDILMYENMTLNNWKKIINKIINIHQLMCECDLTMNRKDEIEQCKMMYIDKNIKRIETDPIYTELLTEKGKEVFIDFINETGKKLLENICWSKYIHGDLHFANILYNPMTNDIKLVDPRGEFGSIIGTAGDMQYDLGKLYHDIYVGYNYIVAEQYREIDNEVKLYWDEKLMNE